MRPGKQSRVTRFSFRLSLGQFQSIHFDEEHVPVTVKNRVQIVLELVVAETPRSRYRERAALTAEEEIAAVRCQERELFFGKGIDVVFEMLCGSPMSILVETDVKIGAGIGLATRVQVLRPVGIGRATNPGRGEDEKFLVG